MSVVASTIVRVKVKIEGLPPGLMFQGKGLMEKDEVEGKPKKPRPPEEEARLRAHWTKVGGKPQLAIPSIMLYRSICKAGSKFKDKKRTWESILAPTMSFEQDMIPLGTDKFETFADWCRIPPRTGAIVKIGRPLLRKWACEFVILLDCEAITNPRDLERIIAEAGKFVGIGANRPQLKGPNGRWKVTGFEIEE